MIDDVVIIGGGAIGCAAALALAKRGARVRVVERARAGAEASSAAAGILGAHAEAHDAGPLTQLCVRSLAMYADWIAAIEASAGLDVGYRRSGSMRAYFDPAELERAAAAATAAFPGDAIALDAGGARSAEPALAPGVAGAVRFPGDARVDPPALLRALEAAARGAGAGFITGEATRVLVSGGRVSGVLLRSGDTMPGDKVVLAAGAWSAIEGSGIAPAHIEPVRGQMLELRAALRLTEHVIFGPGAYVSPRDDGRVLVGSTQERAGYQKAVTVRGARDLLSAAAALVPSLEDAEITGMWSGLRPAAPDSRPLLGQGHARGLIVATGHFRNGILLAPITGEIIAAFAEGRDPPVDLTPFAVERFAPA